MSLPRDSVIPTHFGLCREFFLEVEYQIAAAIGRFKDARSFLFILGINSLGIHVMLGPWKPYLKKFEHPKGKEENEI